jgi:gamma-glutamyltranspeptidase/glutathione hydrolase
MARLPELSGLSEAERAVALARVLDDRPPDGHTTNLSIVDTGGNACVLTSSLGLGSGDFVPGMDLHLNSMLGETDLVRGSLAPGERMGSMMAPSVALDDGTLVLAVGAAGGTRLRGALLQVVSGILDEGLDPQVAVSRPRLHPAAGLVHLEPGFPQEVPAALEAAGFEVRAWPAQHHYFGGVSVVGASRAAGDPRRSGSAATLTRR